MSKVFENTVITGYDKKPIPLEATNPVTKKEVVEDCTVEKALWVILNSAPLRTQNDSIQGMRLAQALDLCKTTGTIEIEDSTHDWLKPITESVTPPIFRVNASLVYEHIKEGYLKTKEATSEPE